MLKRYVKRCCTPFLKRELKRSTQKRADNPHGSSHFNETTIETIHRFRTETFPSLPWEGNGETVETLFLPLEHDRTQGCNSCATGTPNASAMRSMLSKEMFLACRSTWAMKVRCSPASNAKASCVQPLAARRRMTFSASNSRAEDTL